MRLRELDWRYPQFALHRPSEMTLADSELAREVAYAPPIEGTTGNPCGRRASNPRDGIAQCPTRGQLRSAPQARPESVALGGGRGIEEASSLGVGDPCRTHRPAIDLCRRDTDKEDPVESGVARGDRAAAGIRIESSGMHVHLDDTVEGQKHYRACCVTVCPAWVWPRTSMSCRCSARRLCQ